MCKGTKLYKDGRCIPCVAKRYRKYYTRNAETEKAKKRAYYAANKDKHAAICGKYRLEHPEKRRESMRLWQKKNPQYQSKRCAIDINFKLAVNLRGRLRKAIRTNAKSGSAVKDLGCSIGELKLHLESQFQPEMTWETWNLEGWHIDHIIPLSKFDLTDREQFLKASHFSNLQPLWAKDNLQKGDKHE